MQNPLVTFALLTYNQEQYIQEAIEGALAQTYSPLEIIISDDCSSDNTFNIAKNLVANYCGRNKIILNKNDKNLGIGGHVNKIFKMSSGEIIVLAAGDDISVPERVEKIMKYKKDFGKYSLFHSAFTNIDGQSKHLEIKSKNNEGGIRLRGNRTLKGKKDIFHCVRFEKGTIYGCTAAVSIDLINEFSLINENIVQEDDILSFRALLSDGVFFIDEELVKYRVHDNNMWISKNEKDTKEIKRNKAWMKYNVRKQQLLDMNYQKLSKKMSLFAYFEIRFELWIQANHSYWKYKSYENENNLGVVYEIISLLFSLTILRRALYRTYRALMRK